MRCGFVVDDSSQLISQRREKARALDEEGVELYPNDFKVSHTVESVLQHISEIEDSGDETIFSMGGRIVGLRSFGKGISASGSASQSM